MQKESESKKGMANKPIKPMPGTTHRFLWSLGGAAQRQR